MSISVHIVTPFAKDVGKPGREGKIIGGFTARPSVITLLGMIELKKLYGDALKFELVEDRSLVFYLTPATRRFQEVLNTARDLGGQIQTLAGITTYVH